MADKIEAQRYTFKLISNILENMKKLGQENINKAVVQARKEQVERHWNKFEQTHEDILGQADPKILGNDYFTQDFYAVAEERYLTVKSELLHRLQLYEKEERSDTCSARPQSNGTTARSKLPQIPIPTFNGKYQEWLPFKNLFQSIVANNAELSNVEKIHYLKSNVSGEAARLIGNIPVTEENYERAWTKLESRYENKRVLISAQLDILFSIKPIQRRCAREIENLRATVAEVMETLSALGGEVDKWDYILVYLVCQRLDQESHEAWELKLGKSTEPPPYSELDDFLEGLARALETVDTKSSNGTKTRSSVPAFSSRVPSSARVHAATPGGAGGSTCPCCSQKHYLAACPKYREKSVEQRRQVIVEKRLCFNCLGVHRFSSCPSNQRCKSCGEAHHTSIHPSSGHQGSGGSSQASTSQLQASATPFIPAVRPGLSGVNQNNNSAGNVHHAILDFEREERTRDSIVGSLLPTALVTAVSPGGQLVQSRALLDQGSELTFICESLAQTLHLPRQHASISLFGVGAQKSATTKGVVQLRFRNHSNSAVEFTVEAYILPKLTRRLPAFSVDIASWTHLANLELADPTCGTPGPVEILLGANVYGQLIVDDVLKAEPSAPVAQRTHLGWIISGPVSLSASPAIATPQNFKCEVDHELHDLVQSFWSQEEVPPSPRREMSSEDSACEEHFVRTHSRDESGRYVVRLPFKGSPPNFGDSRDIAQRMLTNMHRRFNKNPCFFALYREFLREYESLGHMECAKNTDKPGFYLPHHGVLRDSSETTKLRVVFNGSQKSSAGLSLNDCLHVGPKIQTDLVDVILRWRLHQFAFAADIQKMYRQIKVHPLDRRYQRILWSEEEKSPPLEFQLSTVTYGLGPAPYLAIRVLHQLAEDEGSQFPLAVETVKKNFYVDDALAGADSVEGARELVRQTDGLLMAGGFVLQKWSSNCPSILDAIEDNRKQNSAREFEEGIILRALGLSWSPVEDAFIFIFNQEKLGDETPTKRSVLSAVARLFDPLGWIAPVIVGAKIFLQKLWKTNLDWDQPFPQDLRNSWTSFLETLRSATSFSVPRWVGASASASVELHGFSDASKDAIAAAVYTRVSDGSVVRASLLVAKTKVSPVKPTTIARLELSAAVLLTQLMDRVRKGLDIPCVTIHMWTDSSITLTWIRGQPSQWKEFVGNRVALIQDTIPRARWHHVPGSENPADVASRGATPVQLQEHSSWWNGPPWLSQDSMTWPSSHPELPADANLEERPSLVCAVSPEADVWMSVVGRHSSLDRLLRVTVLVFRAVARMRRSPDAVPCDFRLSALAPEELEKATKFWIRQVQEAHFPAEIKTLRKTEILPSSNHLLRLAPILDEDGLLRVGGRLKNASLDDQAKHPVILPKTSAFTTLVIRDVHLKTLHGGVQLTLSTLRDRFWVIGGRTPVRSHILRCVPCTRQRGQTASQMMGQLPSLRATPARPFYNLGVDYAGPFLVRSWRGRNPKHYKAYLIVFVCLATSAVHLELSTDYSTEGFVAAYRRFTGRRGVPATINSDCGTNLVGADAELKRMFDSAAQQFASLRSLVALDRTVWRFNPPSAPHFGGKWEAAVKSAKFHIKRVIGENSLTYEEFSTLLAQIEGVLNSRPLCPLSDDSSDVSALTPGHFLIGGPLNALPEPSLEEVPVSRLSRWQRISQMLDHFWARWSRECLQRMTSISKWRRPEKQISVGDLVLVTDERCPPARWPLARVCDVHPGTDGFVRVVSVRLASGSTLKRPVVKLCPLPVASEN